MKFKDYYAIMGVARDATQAQVKKAYRGLAHKYHPDVSKEPDAEAKFKDVAEAYATLKDTEKRAAYDNLGKHPSGEEFQPPPNWRDQFDTSSASQFNDMDLEDLLAAFGAGGRGRRAGGTGGANRGPRSGAPPAFRGQDYEVEVPVGLEQVAAGGEVDVDLDITEPDAQGMVHRVPRTYRVRIPKGAQAGQRLRLGGKGGKGFNGGADGDLYVVITLRPHPRYRVSGRDLTVDLPLAPWEAVLGAAVQVPTLGGTVELNVPPKTGAGRKLRLTGRGLPGADDTAGDLYVVVRIEVPRTVSAREEELYRELAAQSRFDPRA